MILLINLFVACTVNKSDKEGSAIKYQPDWQSVKNYEIPVWFNDAKLGILIQWGTYTGPVYGNEWYPCKMYDKTFVRRSGSMEWNYYKHHIQTYGDLKTFA